MPPVRRRSMVARPWRAGRLVSEPAVYAPAADAAPPAPSELARSEHDIAHRRRLLFAFTVLAQAGAAGWAMHLVLGETAHKPLGVLALVLFTLLFAWVAAGFWTAVMGFVVLATGRDRFSVTRTLQKLGPDAPIAPEARTAVIMPICNEHVPTVFGGLRATIESARRANGLGTLDFYILSDSNDTDLRAAEHAAWLALRSAVPEAHVYYRWRLHRSKRKAGNVADFCRRFGADYRYMVVLDADSVMTGDCLLNLVRLMEAHPDAGIIQTAPRAGGHDSLHARIQQFGSRFVGPLFTAGMHFWQLGESHYWGHNAIIRIAPFMQHCALARLPGKGALGGEIMSHDFVEAALMRRAGWRVWIAYDLLGSYEQFPTSLLEELQRDRRWCQGNLQNSRLIAEPGLNPVHRAMFVTGAFAYASAPIWLAFLIVSSVLVATHRIQPHRYFTEPGQLFPNWPISDPSYALPLFTATAAMLFAPKFMGLALALLRGRARGFGGPLALVASAAGETIVSAFLAPVRMAFHTKFVIAAISGWGSGWKSPQREGAATRWRDAIVHHGPHTLIALGWAAAVMHFDRGTLMWLLPVLGPITVAAPVSVLTSHGSIGAWLRRRGLFLTPEEVRMPKALRDAHNHAEQYAPLTAVDFRQAVVDQETHRAVALATPARHIAAEGTLKRRAQRAHIWQAMVAGPEAIDARARMRLMYDAGALRELHTLVLTHPNAHASWFADQAGNGPRRPDVLRRPAVLHTPTPVGTAGAEPRAA